MKNSIEVFQRIGGRFAVRLATAVALASCSLCASADVRLPNGEFREQVEDLRVKVLGGFVRVSRTWQADNVNKGEYRWYVNPYWADLRFELDPIDGSVKRVVRADSTFERSGNDIYVYDRTFFVARRTDQAGVTTGWRWYDREGNWILYAADGKIASYGDRNDIAVHFVRSGPGGQIGAVTDHAGNPVLSFTYDGDGRRITAVTDRAQRKVEYIYTGEDLTEVVDATGSHWHYGYGSGLISSMTDPESRTTQIRYGGNRVVEIVDPMQFSTTWTYDFDRGKRRYTVVEKSPEDRRIERRYDADGELLSKLVGTRSVYALRRDGANVEVSTNERGMTTRVEYDANENPVRTTYPDGSVLTAKYESSYNLVSETVDQVGDKTLYYYDIKGNPTRVVQAAGTAQERETTNVYDEYGQLLSETVKGKNEASGATKQWTYDAYGNVDTATDAEGRTVQMDYDVAGNLTSRIDERGKTWTQRFDAMNRLLEVEDPLGNTNTIEYDKVGNGIRQTDALGKVTTSIFDDNDRLTRIEQPANTTTSFTYDKDGNVLSSLDADGVASTQTFDDGGRLATTSDSAGHTVTREYGATGGEFTGLLSRVLYPTYCEEYRYDQLDRLTQIRKLLPCEGSPQRILVQSAGYDAAGRLVSMTDPEGHATIFAYDALGRVAEITDAMGGKTAFGYDARGNRTDVTDANGNTHRYEYDRSNRLVTERRPLGGAIRFQYDAAGNLTERRSPAGERRAYAYDDAGRREFERHYAADSNVATQTVVFEYDERGSLKGYSQTGDTVSSARYAFDDFGRRTSETVTYGSGAAAFTRTMATAYRSNGTKRRLTYPDQTVVEFGYGANNEIVSAGTPGGSIQWQDYLWGSARRVVFPGVVRSNTFDPLMRPAHIRVQATGSGSAQAPNGDVLMDLHYSFDADGNLAERSDSDGTYTYDYDALDRLTQAVPPASLQAGTAALPVERYGYDAVYNRRSSEHQPGPWNYNADNQLLSYGLAQQKRRFEYDANGHTRRMLRGDDVELPGTIAYSYDAAERLVAVAQDGAPLARYQYDPFGRRIRKETADGVTWFQYSDEGLAVEYSNSGESRKMYGWKPGSDWGTSPLWLADKVAGAWRTAFHHDDAAGKPLRMSDAGGATVWSAVSTAFGETTIDPASSVINPLRFPGQYFDPETGASYNYRRDYQAVTGRYLQIDPIGIRGDLSMYAYAMANPLRYRDNLGLAPGDKFETVEDALQDLRSYAPTIEPKFVEHGGWIYKVGKCFMYNQTTSNMPDRIYRKDMQAIRPSQPVAKWHTHSFRGSSSPGLPENELSDTDRDSAETDGVPTYLIAPDLSIPGYHPDGNRKIPPLKPRKPCKCKSE